jgi:C4-dicarboxylate-binding protein DctP
MQDRQQKARETLIAHGVTIVDPPESDLAALRNQMIAHQDDEAKELKVTPEMVKLVMTDASAAA